MGVQVQVRIVYAISWILRNIEYVERMREKQFNVSALRLHKVLEFVNDNAI